MSFVDSFGNAFDIAARSLVSIVVLFILSKLMGKKQIAQLSLFDYIVGITIGSIAAQMSFDNELEYYEPILAMVIYAVIDIIINKLTNKSMFLRRLFIGVPIVMINKGKLVEKNLMKTKFDVNELLSELRIAGYFNISDVEYAIMETNGELSVLPKSKTKPLTPKDMNISVQQENLLANVIVDGKIMYRNLKACGKSEEWLLKELKKQKQDEISEIILATVDDNILTIFTKLGKEINIEILN